MAALLGVVMWLPSPWRANRAGQVCEPANDNGGGQLVLSGESGHRAALAFAQANGAKKAMVLNVSAPFHCPLMQPAADAMAEALADVTIRPPALPLVSNVLPRRYRSRKSPPRGTGHRHRALDRKGPVHGAKG